MGGGRGSGRGGGRGCGGSGWSGGWGGQRPALNGGLGQQPYTSSFGGRAFGPWDSGSGGGRGGRGVDACMAMHLRRQQQWPPNRQNHANNRWNGSGFVGGGRGRGTNSWAQGGRNYSAKPPNGVRFAGKKGALGAGRRDSARRSSDKKRGFVAGEREPLSWEDTERARRSAEKTIGLPGPEQVGTAS